jgi:hypothetical protein
VSTVAHPTVDSRTVELGVPKNTYPRPSEHMPHFFRANRKPIFMAFGPSTRAEQRTIHRSQLPREVSNLHTKRACSSSARDLVRNATSRRSERISCNALGTLPLQAQPRQTGFFDHRHEPTHAWGTGIPDSCQIVSDQQWWE